MSSFISQLSSFICLRFFKRRGIRTPSNKIQPFHLLGLPYPAFRNIIHQLKLTEVIELSKNSGETRCRFKKN
ncbi:F-box domain-containing protein [Caenorhabditis elegans]|uniref:F-box domain-containing protein n=1 Tax=Caenorhabditis elegans TaxID=6239 RepID=Q8IU11_CAEEL|nr:F-box domain-containing protein [Caenorhabditis elegans]CCD71651.1 F-box domain-containing protein [Caenorhabditis elegans]|eukprot:NP_508368.2 Uncharacterized protein CELE_Y40A1A.2 [Caenorhabditis elegans]